MRFDALYRGTEIFRNSTSSDLLCRKNCLQAPNCLAFTWNNDDIEKQCTLFSRIDEVREAQNFVSGLRHCGNSFFVAVYNHKYMRKI